MERIVWANKNGEIIVIMANPQLEDGHVDIANELCEALARIRLSGEEMQVLWVIFRKTYGWHKKADAISYGQFSQMTGLSRPHVLRAINKLLPKMVIAVTKNGNNGINVYEFNKNFDEWVVLPKKVTVTKKGNKVLPIMDREVLPKKVHTKENITKENKQKKDNTDFELFYKAYPNKKSPKDALKAWEKLNGTRPTIETILEAIRKQIEWRKNANGKFRPEWKHPATWLNKGCWNDEVNDSDGEGNDKPWYER